VDIEKPERDPVAVWHFITFPLNAAASFVLLFFRVPLLGRLVGQGIRLLQEAVSHLLNIADLLLRGAGIRLKKVLRLHIVILRAKGVPVAPADTLRRQIETAQPVLAAAGVAMEVSLHVDDRDAPPSVLDVGANARAYWEDLWMPGLFFEAAAQRHAFPTAFRRLIGLGAPLFAFVVRSMGSGSLGCSLGAAADYVTLDARTVAQAADAPADPALLAHEVGHALGLLHRRGWDNLLCPYSGRGLALTPWQVTIIRGSRHVTFW
jgi:hypothetical protein